MQNNSEYKNFKNIVNIFYNEELEGISDSPEEIKHSGTIKIEPKVFYDKNKNICKRKKEKINFMT